MVDDESTEGIIMIGEIGGIEEERASEWLRVNGKGKKVVGFVCG